MTVPAQIAADLTAMAAAVAAATPLAQSPQAVLQGLRVSANSLVAVIGAEIVADDALVIGPTYSDPISYAAALTSLSVTATEQNGLAELGALTGRVLTNLENVGV